MTFKRVFRFPWRSARDIERDVDEELAFHVDMRAAELRAQGLSAADARREARRRFGDLSYTRRYCVAVGRSLESSRRRALALGELHLDLRQACRALAVAPLASLVAVTTLAVGIGAATVVFSLFNGILLRPLPYADPDRLVQIWVTNPTWRDSPNVVRRSLWDRLRASYPLFEAWQAHARVFDGMALYESRAAILGLGDRTELVEAVRASAGLLTVLGVAPQLGTGFSGAEPSRGASAAVVVSHALWQSHLGGATTVIGETLAVDGQARTIVGVMPAGFVFPDAGADLWLPLGTDGRRGGWEQQSWLTIARLAPGVTRTHAQARLAELTSAILADAGRQSDVGVRIVSRIDEVTDGTRPTLLVLFGAGMLVMLVAMTNVASLILVRAAGRAREVAVRAALGAGRLRLARQFLIESCVLAVTAVALGLTASIWGLPVVRGVLPPSLPRIDQVGIDLRVLGFAAAAAVVVAVVFGAAPALHIRRLPLATVLQASSTPSVGGGRAARARSVLVVGELAGSVLLLVAAFLLVISYWRLQAVDRGFDEAQLLTFGVALPGASYSDPRQAADFYVRLTDRLHALPGVVAAAAAGTPPLRGLLDQGSFVVDRDSREPARGLGQAVTPEYFRALGLRLVRGRGFDARDRAGGPAVKIINETMARRFWPDRDPLGRQIWEGDGGGPPSTIVGVVSDARYRGLDRPVEPMRYTPLAQDEAARGMEVVVRTTGVPAEMAPMVRDQVHRLEPGAAIRDLATMEDLVGRSTAMPRMRTALLVALATIAIVLAMVGLYSVLAFAVAERTREIGLRVALGASPSAVIAGVLGHGLRLAAIGIGVGVSVALALGGALDAYLFDVGARDARAVGAAAGLTALIATAALVAPARRAARIDPITALRRE